MPPKRDGSYTIQEVVELLQSEFPITASNLRYWEKQGLVTPRRTEGGHRVYDDEDVTRLRLIKRLQSKRYFSIDAIKRYLRSGLSNEEIASHLEDNEWLYRPLGYSQGFVPLDLEALLQKTGLSALQVSAMEEAGLLAPFNEGDTVLLYDEDACKLAELVGTFGSYGITPADLEPLRETAAQLARTQLTLFIRRLFSDAKSSQPSAEGRELMPLAEDFVRLLYHHQLQQVARELAKEGFFTSLAHDAAESAPERN
ncbi:MAG TPA: MerR family transcriptional regulator [Stenomitos sp.]